MAISVTFSITYLNPDTRINLLRVWVKPDDANSIRLQDIFPSEFMCLKFQPY